MILWILSLSALVGSSVPVQATPSSPKEILAPQEEIPMLDARVLSNETDLSKDSLYVYAPLRPDITDPLYLTYFEAVSRLVGTHSSDCAKFVNRMIWFQFGTPIWGNAWDVQKRKDNQEILDLLWQVSPQEHHQENGLWYPWGSFSQRIQHFQELYDVLEKQENPLGIIGFVYRYSDYREMVSQSSSSAPMPQTHVAFLAGKKMFNLVNDTDQKKSIKDLLQEKYGVIKSYEYDFVNEVFPLEDIMESGAVFSYEDYLVEEHFLKPVRGSLMEIFLRKHRNNRVEEILRPMSYSQLSSQILENQKRQKEMLIKNQLEIVSREEFENYLWENEEEKQKILDLFHIKNPSGERFLPLPKK